jgi:DNA-binding transcriptional regulator YiaG
VVVPNKVLNFYIIERTKSIMEKEEFSCIRDRLNKTQKQMAQLLGTSEKAVQGYEQGWRNVPGYVERHLFLLLSRTEDVQKSRKACWVVRKCPMERRRQCPAWEFRSGKMCWLINGTICDGTVQKNWKQKMKFCRSCEVLSSLI